MLSPVPRVARHVTGDVVFVVRLGMGPQPVGATCAAPGGADDRREGEGVSAKWNTGNGERKWIVVAFWGVETTVDFFHKESTAKAAYDDAVEQGADALYAKVKDLQQNSEEP